MFAVYRPARLSIKACSCPEQLGLFFPDLADASMISALALVHSRFSTNTFPARGRWLIPIGILSITAKLIPCAATSIGCAHVQGRLACDLFGDDLEKLYPVVYEESKRFRLSR